MNVCKPIFEIADEDWRADKGYLKIDWTDTLVNALSRNGYVMPIIPEIVVVSKKSPYYKLNFAENMFAK